MHFYPKCPNNQCEETNLEIVDSELNGTAFKAIICPRCQIIIYMYLDNSSEVKELKGKVEDLESTISDLESRIDDLERKV